jgi:hypothetical protein
MNRTVLMFTAAAVIAATAACDKKDSNAITGNTDYTSVAITPTTSSLHVKLVPDSIFFDSLAGHNDTIPAHIVPVDSVKLAVSIEPQDVPIANALTNAVTSFSDDGVAEITDDSYLVPDDVGTTTLTVTYTDVNHDFAETTQVIPITVTLAP